jgi:hypothetical protein
MPKENKATLAFIFCILLALFYLFISSFGVPTERIIAYMLVLAFEVWTIANKRKGDTISEGFWEFSSRPLVPFASGFLYAWYTATGVLTTLEIAALAGLFGHFYWQADKVYRDASKKED